MYWLSIFICIGVCDCTLLAACFILLPGSGGGLVVSGGVQPGKPADRTRGNDPQTFFNPSSPFLRFSP